ncbi:MAG: nuclear transport factor 2 family protein [Proteobacteria bacterium]|nr:nuclear transport factor 2 family protein [Pseudomonadota bacterium]
MKIRKIAGVVICLGLIAPAANAGDADALIQLDKEWGSAPGPDAIAQFVTDDLLALDPTGVTGKAEMIEAAASADAPTGPYVAGDYEVRFLSKDIAVMVHSAGAPDPHWSMHVWQKQDGKWRVAATATIPVGE